MNEPMREVSNHLGDSFTAEHLTILAGPAGPGGASHLYKVADKQTGEILLSLHLQCGPRLEVGVNGVLEGTLLTIILDRLSAFQAGAFRTRENALMITKIEEALLWSKARELERTARGVLGTTKK